MRIDISTELQSDCKNASQGTNASKIDENVYKICRKPIEQLTQFSRHSY